MYLDLSVLENKTNILHSVLFCLYSVFIKSELKLLLLVPCSFNHFTICFYHFIRLFTSVFVHFSIQVIVLVLQL